MVATPDDTALLARCSFCGKPNTDVERLVAGPGVYICNECVSLCTDIIAQHAGRSPAPRIYPWAAMSDDELLGHIPRIAATAASVETDLRQWVEELRRRERDVGADRHGPRYHAPVGVGAVLGRGVAAPVDERSCVRAAVAQGFSTRIPRTVSQQATQIRRVGREHDSLPGFGSVRSNDRIDPTGAPPLGRLLTAKPQDPGAARYRLVGVNSAETTNGLVGRGVAWATRDGLGKNDGWNQRCPTTRDQITDKPPELPIGRDELDHSCVEDDHGVGHGDTLLRSRAAPAGRTRLEMLRGRVRPLQFVEEFEERSAALIPRELLLKRRVQVPRQPPRAGDAPGSSNSPGLKRHRHLLRRHGFIVRDTGSLIA